MAAPLILAAAVLGLVLVESGCRRSENKKGAIGPDPSSKPIGPPKPIPPVDRFHACFGKAKDYDLVVEDPGRALCGRFNRVSFFNKIPKPARWDVCLPPEACDTGPGIRFGRPFHLNDGAQFASFPLEARIAHPGTPVWLDTFTRDWNFSYLLDGGFYDDCRFLLEMWQAVKMRTPSGEVSLSRNLSGFRIPLYAPRKDGKICMAEPDYSNEKILNLDAPLCASFPSPAGKTAVTATEVKAGSECDDRLGKTLALKFSLQMR